MHESEEDAHLSRILNKQKLYQQQLSEDFHQSVSTSISPNTTLNSRISQESSAGLDPSITNQQGRSMEANISFQAPYDRNPLRAWTQGRPSTQMNTARQGINRSDVYVQDITSQDLDASSNASSGTLLVSDSVYLPVDEKTPRPTTAPEIRPSSPPSSHIENSNIHNVRPSTAMANNRDKPNSKYDAYDKRPVKPLNQELAKGIAKPSFHISSPQRSPNEPSQGNKRMATPPIAQAQDYDTSQDLNNSDQENIAIDEPAQNELTLIKDKIGARRARSFTKGTKEVKKNIKNINQVEKTDNVVYSKSGIPVRSGVQSKIDTGIKRQRSLQQTISELTKNKSKKNDSHKEKTLNSTHDSGFATRPGSDAIFADYSEDDHKAAVSIQAFWRGYWARQYNRDVVSVRKEIRARRAEDHILVLKAELERQRKMYEQERQLRNLQLEAIRYLWKEVQSLQSWKSEVLLSPSLKITDTNKHVDNSNYNDKLQSTLEKMDTLTNKPDNSLQSADFERRQELEKTCSTLQSQVSHLQESLYSLSSYIFNSESFQTDFQQTVQESPIDVLGSFDEELEKSTLDDAKWGSVPHSLSPYPSEEEEMYFQRVPQAGFPTPPRGLRIQHSNGHSVILKWSPSKILDAYGREIRKPLLGYRIHVNEQPKSLIGPQKTKALVIGLNSRLTYKFYVKAVAPLGESFESNIVMAALGKGHDKTQDCSSSDIDQSDDSDKDHDSTETHDRKKLKKETRHKRSRKVRSPRLEKNKSKDEVSGGSSQVPNNDFSDDSRPQTAKSEIQKDLGIFTQPKLHTHRRSHSKDYHEKLPDCQMMSSSEMAAQSTASYLPTKETVVRFSDTLTLDSQSSILSIIGAKLPEVTTEKPPTPESEFIKTHRRKRSKELKVEGENVYDSSALKQSECDTKEVEKSPVYSSSDKKGKDFNIPDSPHKEGKLHGHKRKKSKDLQTHDQGSYVTDAREQDISSKSVPIIDGRRRHASGGRPDSPKVVESEDRTKISTPEKRRQPVADILEQRFSSSLKSSAQITDKPVNTNASGESETLTAERSASVENVNMPEDASGNKSSNSSPTYTVRQRTRSVGSDSDINVGTCRAIQDFDQKSSNTTTHVVANLLKKLQSFTKSQKETIQEKSKLRKKSSEQQPSLSRESTFMSDDERAAKRRVSGSDSEALLSESSALHSDSSSGGHSDDNRSGRHRTHRRTPSDHKLSNIGKDLSFSGSGHSPIIMEGGSLKKQTATSVKRTASFNGATLPSRKHDINKKGMSGSEENLAEKQVKPGINQQDS